MAFRFRVDSQRAGRDLVCRSGGMVTGLGKKGGDLLKVGVDLLFEKEGVEKGSG